MKLLVILLLSLILSGMSHATEITIGLIPEQNVFKQVKRYKPLGDYIENKTGIKINFTILSRYGNIIESFHRKKLDGAFWGSFTGAMAIRKIGIQPIARPVNLDGSSKYHGYILVRKDSNIKNVSDMKGKTIAFVEKATTAGYVFPVAYFSENGVADINTYFNEYYFTGSHDAAIHAVLNKKADIACAKNTIYNLLSREDPRIKNDLVIIAQSPDVPSNGLGLREQLAYRIKSQLKETLIDMNKDPDGKLILRKFGAMRFIETTENDYAPVFEISRRAGIDLMEYEYVNK